jgi:hypothetical protein
MRRILSRRLESCCGGVWFGDYEATVQGFDAEFKIGPEISCTLRRYGAEKRAASANQADLDKPLTYKVAVDTEKP